MDLSASNQELLDFHERAYEFKHLGLSQISVFLRNPSSLFVVSAPTDRLRVLATGIGSLHVSLATR